MVKFKSQQQQQNSANPFWEFAMFHKYFHIATWYCLFDINQTKISGFLSWYVLMFLSKLAHHVLDSWEV